MDHNFLEKIIRRHTACHQCPDRDKVISFFEELLGLLFPNFVGNPVNNMEALKAGFENVLEQLGSLIYDMDSQEKKKAVEDFKDFIPLLHEYLEKDVAATYEGDPAAEDNEEIIRSYPGFYAISAYRMAHQLKKIGIKGLPRTITEHAHSVTGIDIHPSATIGEYFCIDHGTGVVIGETTVIGKRVKIYQGVTLGALSVDKKDAKSKRHPTIEDGVVIYAGATILGGKTIIGHSSVIGGNVWITKSVPPYSKVYYKANNDTNRKR